MPRVMQEITNKLSCCLRAAGSENAPGGELLSHMRNGIRRHDAGLTACNRSPLV